MQLTRTQKKIRGKLTNNECSSVLPSFNNCAQSNERIHCMVTAGQCTMASLAAFETAHDDLVNTPAE